MFTFIITTNRATKEIDKTLEVLLNTKTPSDKIIVINYNNYSLKYRGMDGIDYRHVKASRREAINRSLPKSSNVVILGDNIIVTEGLVKSLYKHYDFRKMHTLRVDTITGGGKFIESDYRIGSTIDAKSFIYWAMAFNTGGVSTIGETPEETAIIATKWDMSLSLLPNVRVLVPGSNNKKPDKIGMTILVPSLTYKYINDIKEIIRPNDKVFEFDSTPRGMTKVINQKIMESHNQCIVIINPLSTMNVDMMMNRIRGLFDDKRCMLFDTGEGITDDAWLAIPKTRFSYSHKTFDTVGDLQANILSYNDKNLVSYIDSIVEETPIIDNSSTSTIPEILLVDNMISIIIPFMHNGDRWPLFKSSIERLYHYTKKYSNIEIIVHETAPKRFLKPDFIKRYELVYLFSEYNGLFHRAWNLNVPARYMARGDTFVFFDGDLLIDEKWVEELILCDKSKPFIGWGEMVNLNKKGTDIYLKTGKITNNVDRVRKPDGHAAAAGINVISRSMFFSVGGWPEAYKGYGYGGEDNSLSFKMITLGMYDQGMKSWK